MPDLEATAEQLLEMDRRTGEAGHRHTFIVADAGDWPRHLYAKLGFEPCGVLHVFRRDPPAG